MINKVTSNIEKAIDKVSDVDTVMIGGFVNAGQPVELIDALIEYGAKHLTIISNNAGNGSHNLAALPQRDTRSSKST